MNSAKVHVHSMLHFGIIIVFQGRDDDGKSAI